MADAQTYDTEVTLAPFNIGSSSDVWYLKNKQLLLSVLSVNIKEQKDGSMKSVFNFWFDGNNK
jgi:hypothetical protein